jgi:hypothetical protein
VLYVVNEADVKVVKMQGVFTDTPSDLTLRRHLSRIRGLSGDTVCPAGP